jgi:hypothetical protein
MGSEPLDCFSTDASAPSVDPWEDGFALLMNDRGAQKHRPALR